MAIVYVAATAGEIAQRRKSALVEKRVLLFMVLSAAIMASYVGFQAAFGPKTPPKPVAKKPDVADKKQPAEKKAEAAATEKPEAADPSEKPEGQETDTAVAATDAQQKWVTLGSVDPESPYRMLVTFSSLGGGIERIEMASPQYRDLDDRTRNIGYLGHLAPLTTKGSRGVEVRVVGAGTPAARATAIGDSNTVGLQVGDIIQGLNDITINSTLDLQTALLATKPGEQVKLKVTRGDAPLEFDVKLGHRPLEVISPEADHGEYADLKSGTHPLSYLMSLVGPRHGMTSGTELSADPLRNRHWDVKVTTDGDGQVVEFSYRLDAAQAENLGLSGPAEIVRRYRLATVPQDERADPTAMAYHLNMQIEIRNLGTKPLEFAYQLDGPTGLPIEGWWYTNKIGPTFTGAGARDIVWRRHGRSRNFRTTSEIYHYAKKNPDKPAESLLGSEDVTYLDYVGVDAQYFSTVLLPDVSKDSQGAPFRTAVSMVLSDIEKLPKVEYKRTNVTYRVTSDLKTIPVDGAYKQDMRVFAGPKIPSLLARYDIDDVIEYGWFRIVSIPLAHLLHFLKHNIFFNYGLAIVALTVIVRGCMVPFSLKAAKNAKMMQDLQPELKAIAEKYKNDLPKRSEAQSALFKKYNYNPLSGCLPMFLQLPIFLGLYRALATDIELRQAPLIPGIQWASNLSGPDQFWYWRPYLPDFLAGEASGWLGPYLNILPLISVAFLLVHQKLFTPPATDEQTKMTQDMMKYMTVFMGVLFFKVPAGLCIYFITSSLWSICERLWLPKTTPKPATEGADTKTVTAAAKATANGAAEKARQKKLKQKRK